MKKRIRQAFTSLKERMCVSYAKIATIGGFCNIVFILAKATSPDDFPLPSKYVDELLNIFSISPSSHRAFALVFTRRFSKTKSWRVALKCLLLLHCLLRSLPYDSPFRAELLWTRTNSLLSLYPCHFRDSSSSDSQDYTTFLRSYARLLDEALDCFSMEITEEEEQEPLNKMKESVRMIEMLPQLQSLLDRIMDCWPTGAASRSFLVHLAMRHIIHDSFSCYTTLKTEIVMVLDNLIQLPYRSCVAAFGIYKNAAFQADKLSQFHEWCKSMGYCESYEYPLIDRIPDIQIHALEIFLNGMWQLTDQSSSSNISTQTSPLTDEDGDKQGRRERDFDEVMKKDMEIIMEPLTQREVESNSVGWEDLLEASISPNYAYGKGSRNDYLDGRNGWQMQVHNPYDLQSSNPFYQQRHRTNFNYGYSCPNTPMHTWGL
ncbi:hypothetical protein CDL12_02281 [Handroanthus impetiginosus]|uniref:ENTH domain-containing protein n=1 Tax=Handroanthus impetiginosus TaxID=429701 RepID=A0A2G9I5E2_9LAMI|nr:hypothetical protein CDL12_02281 [Handroanthus impetiginosus]